MNDLPLVYTMVREPAKNPDNIRAWPAGCKSTDLIGLHAGKWRRVFTDENERYFVMVEAVRVYVRTRT